MPPMELLRAFERWLPRQRRLGQALSFGRRLWHFGRNDIGKAFEQLWGVGMEHIPNDVVIHAIIAMNQPVAHANDFAPRNLSMPFAQFDWQPRGRFADQFDRALGGELVFPIGFKLAAAAFATEG